MKTSSSIAYNADRHWVTTASIVSVVLLVLLISLAIVQYRWLAELRQAERRQMEVSLKATADHFSEDFVSELLRVATAFQLEYRSSQSLLDQVKDAYEQWVGSAAHPDLIGELFLLRTDDTDLRTLRFDRESGTLQAVQLDNALEPLTQQLAWYSANESLSRTASYPKNPIFFEEILTLAVPFVATESYQVRSQQKLRTDLRDVLWWTVARLDRKPIIDRILPGLFASHFGVNEPPPYRIAIATAEKPHDIVYQSDSLSEEDLNSSDLVLDLLPEVDGQLKGTGPQTIRIVAPETPQWRLFVKHRLGSVDAAVESLRSRNLGISLSILLVLAAGLVLVVISASRARMLARTQVEFAAAVSHELRTPLAVIKAASYNLEEGIAVDPMQIRYYAGLVKQAGRRLSKMVDQILLFAETQSARRKTNIGHVKVADIVENALDSVSITLGDQEWRAEKYIEPDLPSILADPVLLSHCIQNLLSNAVKYGQANDHKPVRITALRDTKRNEVQIRVADDGPGIAQTDLPHIFEPFYRGTNVEGEISGAGLGLALVRRLILSQGGRVSVETEPNVGSTFILHIRAAV